MNRKTAFFVFIASRVVVAIFEIITTIAFLFSLFYGRALQMQLIIIEIMLVLYSVQAILLYLFASKFDIRTLFGDTYGEFLSEAKLISIRDYMFRLSKVSWLLFIQSVSLYFSIHLDFYKTGWWVAMFTACFLIGKLIHDAMYYIDYQGSFDKDKISKLTTKQQ